MGKTTSVNFSSSLIQTGILFAWGYFEVIAFKRLDFGTEHDPATGDHPGGAGKALPWVATQLPLEKRCQSVFSPCSAASEARQRIVKWQIPITIRAFR